jgi:predicted RNase H-like nuclease (RuvC/YqgF family)
MASFRKNAEVTVTLNGEAANNMLKLMAERAKAVGDRIREIAKKGAEATGDERKQLADLQKEHKSLEAAQKNVTTATYDYAKVLKNLNGSSLRELEKAKKALRAQLQHLTPETQKYINTAGQLKNVEARIKQLNTGLREQQGGWGKLFSAAKQFVPVAIGIGSVVAVVQKVGSTLRDATKSTQTTGDAWEKMVTGMKSGYQAFMKTIATGDWTNFFTNIRTAIQAGQKYAEAMDLLGD